MRTTPDLSAQWRKSSYSNTNGGECVEVANGFAGIVPVRDSKDSDGPVLILEGAAWSSFVVAIKDMEFAVG